jgi:hypothetical protein
MKAKKFTKRLVLNKKTIVNLNGITMTKVFGGATVGDIKIILSVCPTTCYTCLGTGCMC